MTVTPSAEPRTLDDFFEHVRSDNPFAANRVVVSTRMRADAPQVHQRQFGQLVELAGRARKQHAGIGALLWGEAGIGKSHLLARLGNWAGPNHAQALFIYLSNLQAEPEQLPRSLLKCVLSILTRGRTNQFNTTPLFYLVNSALRHALRDQGTQHSWRQAEIAYDRLVDELCDRSPGQAAVVDRQAYAVLFRFFRSAYLPRPRTDDRLAALAVRWLSGDTLDADEARALGIPLAPRRDVVALADDEQIKKVLIALAQLASFGQQPFVLCLDQVDNLEPEQLAALARFLHALLDSAGNLLVITAGVRDTIARWQAEGVIQKSTWDRLAQYEVELQRITLAEARQVLHARLQPFLAPFLTLEPIRERIERDSLFPLGETWVAGLLAGKVDVRPRDLINRASEGWRRQQDALQELGGAAWLEGWEGRKPPTPPAPVLPPADVQRLLDEKVDLQVRQLQRQCQPQNLPPDRDNLAGLLHNLLRRCLRVQQYASLTGVERVPPPKGNQRAMYDLILRHSSSATSRETRSAVLCLVVENRNSMTAWLRRLTEDAHPPERLFLVTDERWPLAPGATGQEYLEQLRQRYGERFRQVQLTFEDYAELHALQAVLGLARSGDLELSLPGGVTRRISEEEVLESYHRCQRFLAHPLLRLLLTAGETTPPVPAPSPAPANGSLPEEQDLRQFIMSRLALAANSSSADLASQYQDYLQRKHVQVGLEVCRARLEEVARQLQQEGLLNLAAQDGALSLLKR